MKNKIFASAFLIFLLAFGAPALAQWKQPPVDVLKKEARAYLLKRKRGFDQYLSKKEQARKERLKDAYKMKEIREQYAQQREKARKSFVRKTEPFPREAYVRFLQKREQRRKQLEKSRKDYVAVQDELEQIYEDKKYKIDGNKEFDL